MVAPKPLADVTFRRASELLHETGMGEGCWESPRTPSQDYPMVRHHGKFAKVSRVVWTGLFGPLSTALIIRHRCDNPRCIRPAHLTTGSHSDNRYDCVRRGRDNNQNKLKEVCAQGHSNWAPRKRGGRVCVSCKADEQRRRRAAAKR